MIYLQYVDLPQNSTIHVGPGKYTTYPWILHGNWWPKVGLVSKLLSVEVQVTAVQPFDFFRTIRQADAELGVANWGGGRSVYFCGK